MVSEHLKHHEQWTDPSELKIKKQQQQQLLFNFYLNEQVL